MNYGTHTTIEQLAQRLLHRWVPKWYEGFTDGAGGGFHERLGHSFKPVKTGQRRLLTQCRQLAFYSHAARMKSGACLRPRLRAHFDYMIRHYYDEERGGWWFSVNDDGVPLDRSFDLYSLSFVIFGLCHYYRVDKDAQAKKMARDVLDFIDGHFRMQGRPGLAEALDEDLAPLQRTRRQNPHMHLLEACLFAYETWSDPAYRRMADEMVGLFYDHFLIGDGHLLCEYFDDDLNPHDGDGARLEPGHHCEWVWLLKKHAVMQQDETRHDRTCMDLLRFANHHGWDEKYGGIYDEVAPDGTILKDTKRIWTFTEALKANALMLDSGEDRDALKNRIGDMVRVFRSGYIKERGFWTEWLNRDLSPATDYMPGTTPYHVYFGIMETRDAIHARGRTKSMAAGPLSFFYRVRRTLSALVVGTRKKCQMRLRGF